MKNRIADLLSPDHLRQLADQLHLTTGLSTTVMDVEGRILAGAGWQEICNRFHRVHEKTAGKCLKNAAVMQKRFQAGQSPMLCKCPNGLYDAVVPVVMNGRTVASLFAGQFLLYRPDISDIEQFSDQARSAGFDEIDYLNALEKVPTRTPAQIDEILGGLRRLSKALSKMAENGRCQSLSDVFSCFNTSCTANTRPAMAGQYGGAGRSGDFTGADPAFRMSTGCDFFSAPAVQNLTNMLSTINSYLK